MSNSLGMLVDLVDTLETPIRSYPSASGFIADHVYRMLKAEYRALRHKLAGMHKHDWRRGDLLKHVRSLKLELKRRQLEFSLTV